LTTNLTTDKRSGEAARFQYVLAALARISTSTTSIVEATSSAETRPERRHPISLYHHARNSRSLHRDLFELHRPLLRISTKGLVGNPQSILSGFGLEADRERRERREVAELVVDDTVLVPMVSAGSSSG
jgi:hypothetical protein